MKLADALLRRKELQQKVDQIRSIKDKDLFEFKFEYNVDDIKKARVPKCELNQVTEEFDYYANKLRLIDSAIQELNWTTHIYVDEKVWLEYAESKKQRLAAANY